MIDPPPVAFIDCRGTERPA